jgi:hypothetical protein
MTHSDESRIRRDGFPIDKYDADSLLQFIELWNPSHDTIEPEIYVKLEIIAGRLNIVDARHVNMQGK